MDFFLKKELLMGVYEMFSDKIFSDLAFCWKPHNDALNIYKKNLKNLRQTLRN